MRTFPDFLAAYEEFADDGFSPPQFQTWTALSLIAGALERKVWLPWSPTYAFHPNIYVMLISRPGAGKSVSLNKGVDLLKEVNRKTGALNVLPSQITEAKFIEMMGQGRSFVDRSGGREVVHFQNAGYYFASEASNSLRNIFGDFIACLTDFYDCPSDWSRATKKDGEPIRLRNVCMNLLAGSTFDYLGKLIGNENIQGGFASRIIYVVQREALIKRQKWQNGLSPDEFKLHSEYAGHLVHDLTAISKMSGPMTADSELGEAWSEWWYEERLKTEKIESEKIQTLMARHNTNMIKTTMLLSAAESDDRVLRIRHWNKAKELLSIVMKELPIIFMESNVAQGPRSKTPNFVDALTLALMKRPGASREVLQSTLIETGYLPREISDGIAAQLRLGKIRQVGGRLELVSNPQNDL